MLDLSKVAGQISEMAAGMKTRFAERQEQVAAAGERLRAVDFNSLQRKIKNSKTTWLTAGLVENPSTTYKAPVVPDNFTVLATDGSQIDVDRHHSARCFLINIGTVMLKYGDSPDALLTSEPHLYSGDKDMVITPEGASDRQQVIEGNLLGIKRAVDEAAHLAKLGKEVPGSGPVMALLDGSLILWGLAGREYPDFVIESLLDQGMLKHFSYMKKLNEHRQFALASYISFPRGSDVANALRIAVCPHDIVDTDKYCSVCESRECDQLAGVQDRDIYDNLLNKGERSSLFFSNSSIVQKYGEHRVHFFYLKADDEIARVEIPEWVANNVELLNMTHCIVLDQCCKGQGYPAVLSEAHEQAVVTGVDRDNFWQLVETSLVDEHIKSSSSAKSQSKKTRWL